GDPAARRGDERPRHQDRARDPAGARSPAHHPHRHRPPPEHHPPRRPDPGDGRRPPRRAGAPRGSPRLERRLRQPGGGADGEGEAARGGGVGEPLITPALFSHRTPPDREKREKEGLAWGDPRRVGRAVRARNLLMARTARPTGDTPPEADSIWQILSSRFLRVV